MLHDFCSKIGIINDIPSNYYSHLNELLITAGGSTHFDIVGKDFQKLNSVPIKVLLRSGCLLHMIWTPRDETAKSDSNNNGINLYNQLLKFGRMYNQRKIILPF